MPCKCFSISPRDPSDIDLTDRQQFVNMKSDFNNNGLHGSASDRNLSAKQSIVKYYFNKENFTMPCRAKLLLGAAAGMLLLASRVSRADESPFNYIYAADSMPKGTWEYEQWHTLRAGKA